MRAMRAVGLAARCAQAASAPCVSALLLLRAAQPSTPVPPRGSSHHATRRRSLARILRRRSGCWLRVPPALPVRCWRRRAACSASRPERIFARRVASAGLKEACESWSRRKTCARPVAATMRACHDVCACRARCAALRRDTTLVSLACAASTPDGCPTQAPAWRRLRKPARLRLRTPARA
jgi:hypothetical protein